MSSTPTAAAAKGGKKNWLVIGLVAIIVAGGAGFGYYWWTHGDTAKAAEGEEHEKKVPSHERGIVKFEPFVVNLADPNTSRFLRVSIQLVVGSPEEAKKMAESAVVLMQARSAILELLTTQTSQVIVTPEGKTALREAIKEHLEHAGDVKVIDVLFSDFVVQF
jgi:flagellar FliL protein